MDRLIERGMENNASFSRFNPEGGAPIKVPAGERPTYSDLMSTMKMDRAEINNLADALYQMGLAEGTDVNVAGKERYAAREGSYQPVFQPEGNSTLVDVAAQVGGQPGATQPKRGNIFDSPAGFFYDGADVAYIPNSKRARIDGQNINIQPALRQLSDPDAAAPFIGATAEDGEAPMAYRKGFGPDVSIEQGYRAMEERNAKKGKRRVNLDNVQRNVKRARGVEERFLLGQEYADQRAAARMADSLQADIELKIESKTLLTTTVNVT